MSFIEVEFPRTISYKAMGGPTFNTTVNEGKPGFEQRNQNWSTARGNWTVSLMTPSNATSGLTNPQQFIDQLEAFFLVCAGKANGFRLKDHKDFTNGPSAQSLGTGDGLTGQWQLIKKYTIGSLFSYTRVIVKPITSLVVDYLGNAMTDTIDVTVNGNLQTRAAGYAGTGNSQYTVDQTSGVVNFRTYAQVTITKVTVNTSANTATYTYTANLGDSIIRLNEQIVVTGTGAPTFNDGTFVVTGIGAGIFVVPLTTQINQAGPLTATGVVRATKLTITSAAQSGSNTTYAYSASAGQTIVNGMRITVAGFTTSGNNGVFYIQSNVPGVSVTVINASGANETHAATGYTDWVPQLAATITATYQFHFPVRFDTDALGIQVEDSDINDGHPIVTWNSIVLRELRLQIVNGVSQG